MEAITLPARKTRHTVPFVWTVGDEPRAAQMLLTEKEAATVLRKSVFTVQRLRRAGKLRYLPGRPVLIDEVDLEAYVQRTKRRNGAPPKVLSPEQINADAERWLNESTQRRARRAARSD